MDPLDAKKYYDKGYNLFCKGCYKESIPCFEEASKYKSIRDKALKFKGIAYYSLEEYQKAYDSFEQTNFFRQIKKICQSCTQHAVSTSSLFKEAEHSAEILCFTGMTIRKLEEDETRQRKFCSVQPSEYFLEKSKEKLEEIRNENKNKNKRNNCVLKKLGIVYYLLKEYDKSITVFNEILKTDDNLETLDTLKSTGLICYECKQYNKAYEMFNRAIKVMKGNGKEDYEPYCHKAILLAKLRCCDVLVKEAYNACEKATKLAPKNYEVRSNEGMIYYFLEEYSKAVKAFEKALDIASTESEGKIEKKLMEKREKTCTYYELSMKGLSHFKLGSTADYKEAYKCFLQALRQNPNDIETLNLRGIVLYRLNEPTKAKEAFQRALSIDPSDLFTRNNLGWLLLSFGNLDEAYSQIKDYLILYTRIEENTKDNVFYEIKQTGQKLRPGTREFDKYARRMGWGWCLKGQIDIEKHNYREALESFDQAIKWDKTFSLYLLWHAYARYLRAKYYYGEKSGKYQEELITIVRDLEKIKSRENNRVDAYALYFLGICYCKMGNYLQAKEKLIECVNLKMEKEKPVIGNIQNNIQTIYKKKREKLLQLSTSKPHPKDIQEVAKTLLGNVWTYQIKPPWHVWWLDSPSNKTLKRITFIVIFTFTFSLMIYVIQENVKENLNQFLLAEIALIFLLVSPSISRIAGKDISIEIQSPTFSAVEFYPEMPPFNLEDARPIRDISSKSGATRGKILFFDFKDLLKK